jgi:hypothetical protein
MENATDLKPKYGIVAMIDALGVRNATIEESITFIKNVKRLVGGAPGFMSAYLQKEESKHKKFQNEPPKLTTFGDTIIFSWEMKPEELSKYFSDVGIFLSYVVESGIENQLAFRGAVSVGNYIQSGPTVLGTAISDAAAWYDVPEIMGVIATPYCGQFLNIANEQTAFPSGAFKKYLVPLKGGISKDLWITDWPHLLNIFSKVQNQNVYESYYTHMKEFPIPKGTEDKHFNTEIYFKLSVPNELKNPEP